MPQNMASTTNCTLESVLQNCFIAAVRVSVDCDDHGEHDEAARVRRMARGIEREAIRRGHAADRWDFWMKCLSAESNPQK